MLQVTSPNSPLADNTRGQALKDFMARHKVSQARLAAAAQLDQKTVAALANGRRDGNVATWAAMARGLSAITGQRVGIDQIRGLR